MGFILIFDSNTAKFGALRTPHTPPDVDSDSEDEVEVDNTHAMPRIEEWRMNLTALSQYHNVCDSDKDLKHVILSSNSYTSLHMATRFMCTDHEVHNKPCLPNQPSSSTLHNPKKQNVTIDFLADITLMSSIT